MTYYINYNYSYNNKTLSTLMYTDLWHLFEYIQMKNIK